MTQKDSNFLLWLAKRLVFKYGENKEILSVVSAIVNKNTMITNSVESLKQNIIEKLNQNIKLSTHIIYDLQQSDKNIRESINNAKSDIILSRFEDLNIDEVLNGDN